ncbi:MAG: branched-chain amino acid aminotransferase [Candidatus Thorarchaeota archaeon]
MKIKVTRAPNEQLRPKPNDMKRVGFGTIFTDHMLIMRYRNGAWETPEIVPYGPLPLDPATSVLHYGQGIFEGMKAYRRGRRIFLFRPRDNFERLNRSAERMVMPTIDVDLLLDSLKELLLLERDWIPQDRGTSLYIRPTMIATDARLGVHPSKEYLYFVILSPVGPYFDEGFNPIRVIVSDKYVRSAPGGVGHAKTIGNYAAGLKALKEAIATGHSQVLWLDAVERRYVEEVATMNFFAVFGQELVTPPLSDTILPGVTRASVIELARSLGTKVSERPIAIDELIAGIRSGTVTELFGTGTAAIVAPIGQLTYKGNTYTVRNGEAGEMSRRLFDLLTDLQVGLLEDKWGWVESIECPE